LLTDFVGDGRLLEYGARFAAQVWPGDTLTGVIEVTAVDAEARRVELRLTVNNQDGKAVLTGTAAAAIEA
jgi:acyl dehydratase